MYSWIPDITVHTNSFSFLIYWMKDLHFSKANQMQNHYSWFTARRTQWLMLQSEALICFESSIYVITLEIWLNSLQIYSSELQFRKQAVKFQQFEIQLNM